MTGRIRKDLVERDDRLEILESIKKRKKKDFKSRFSGNLNSSISYRMKVVSVVDWEPGQEDRKVDKDLVVAAGSEHQVLGER